MSENSSSLYWISLPDEVEGKGHDMPLIITVAVFRQQGGEVLWELLPLTAEILDGVATQHHREGAITAKVHEGTDIDGVIHNVSKMLVAPLAKQTSLVVFCQNGEIAERFLDLVRNDQRLKLEMR